VSGTLLVCAAPLPGHGGFYRDLISGYPGRVIAVDAGAGLCQLAGRMPDVLVGDLDSVTPEVRAASESAGVRVLLAPADKDFTDLDLALSTAITAGEERVLVTAAWSGRLDHTLAAAGSVLADSPLTIDLVDPRTAGWVLDSLRRRSVSLEGPGSTFSLLAVDPGVRVTCTGARYPLRSAALRPLSSLGVSNVVLEGGATVIAEQGRVLVLTHAVGGAGPARVRPES